MNSSESISLDDLQGIDWQAVIDTCEEKQCVSYCQAFHQQASRSSSEGNEKREKTLRLLGGLSGFHFTPENIWDPFQGPSTFFDGLEDGTIGVLQQFAPTISDPELRARVADIVWLKKRDHQSARVAIDAYLASAAHLEDPKEWSSCADRIERAVRLSALLNDGELLDKAVAHIEAVLVTWH